MKKNAGFVNLYSKDLSTKKWPENIHFLIAFWGSVFLIVLFLIIYGFALSDYFEQSAKNKNLLAEYNELSVKDKELLKLSVKLRELNIKSKALTDTIKSLNSLFTGKVYWTKFIEIFSSYLNDNVWINSLSIDKMGRDKKLVYVQVQGGAISLKDLNRFVEKVEKDNKNVKVSFKVVDKDGVVYYSFGMNFTFNTENLK